ncbi:MAG: phosphosulfolactate synthase [Bacteroidales bacterium]|nr:phosphosulfolactate synthase [Bacteroidales bacterium]MCB9013621.1 phosphosulfolactate synthase [Bacteroidales bacterium]
MNIKLPYLPDRSKKKRESGVTMMMDKGLSLIEAESFVQSSSEFTDLVKFGFGTSLLNSQLKEKVKLYKKAGIAPYFGGTLFELFIVRDMYDEFRKYISDSGLEYVEVSDGSILLDHDEKLEYIHRLSKDFTVLSEVGSKVKDVEIPPDEWVNFMKAELEAGAWKVIAEARESGTIGIYNSDGSANTFLIDDIVEHVSVDKVLWEAPNKAQQVWFIKLLGADVNLGNIAPYEVVSLEALRLGLRGDTLFDFLPQEFQDKKL